MDMSSVAPSHPRGLPVIEREPPEAFVVRPQPSLGSWLDQALERMSRAAATAIPMWIMGPLGTPRFEAAKAIHGRSGRLTGRFEAVDCRAIGASAAELAIFGPDDAPGALERARGGTVFLDEVDALSARGQARLSRLLERRSILKGQGREVAVDVRLLAGSSVDLKAEAMSDRFRPDLLYRLAGLSLHLAPLTQRRADIALLAEERLLRSPTGAGRRLGREAAAALEAYPWPGNERELDLVIARALLVADGEVIEAHHLFLGDMNPLAAKSDIAGSRVLSFDEHEERGMRAALAQTDGNITLAAKLLGIGRATFYRKARKYGVVR